MKKILLIPSFFLFLFAFLGCAASSWDDPVEHSSDDPLFVEMTGDSLAILQLTDLHLNNALDPDDKKTLQAITTLVESRAWDLVVLTGDLVSTLWEPRQMKRLADHMEALGVPWTFCIGNHETDTTNYRKLLGGIEGTEHLLFQTGPDLEDGSCGVFRIVFTKEGIPFYTLYFLDSSVEDAEGRHEVISEEEVEWYSSHVAEDATASIAFTHIPPLQFEEAVDYEGIWDEDVCPQESETGFFRAMVEGGKTVALFVGHDHLNDYSFTMEGILLAYGRKTGYNSYGDLDNGGRVIEIDPSGAMTTFIVTEKDAE